MPDTPLSTTPLHALHLELGAETAAYAGHSMPVSYPGGVLAEHRHTRDAASLFDLSHLGQIRLVGDDAAAALESLGPVDVRGLAPGRRRYGFLTTAGGGILDDLTIIRREGDLLLVVNAGRKAADLHHLVSQIGHRCSVIALPDQALLALQGPKAAQALAKVNADAATLGFKTGRPLELAGIDCFVTRSGYTGEDGFELSVPADRAESLARKLLGLAEVRAAGLGARDTLRIEAGHCLHGQDIDETTTPVEAGLAWAIPAVRRAGGERAGGYPGADVIDSQLVRGPTTRRVGLLGLERVPVRAGAPVVDAQGHALGRVTSGVLSPTLDRPVAMAYLAANHALPSHEVQVEVRGHREPLRVVTLPFVPHRYFRA